MYRFFLVVLLFLTACKENSSSTSTTTNSSQTPTAQPNTSEVATPSADASSQPSASNQSSNNTMEQPAQSSSLDARIFGTWKNTEVISSGSGDSYGSFSSETFIEFTADGVFATWAGQSAGSGGGQSFESNGSSQKQSLKYRTEDRMIVFVDPSSGQEAKTKYAVDGSRLMLSDGAGHNKIYIKE